jgi:hypothetical protein
MTTITKRKLRARDAVLELVLARPGITTREIANELSDIDEASVILDALIEADLVVSVSARGAGQPEREPLAAAWGSEPSDEELADARCVGEGAEQAALDDALDGALTREMAANRIGVTPQAVSERRKAGKLVGLRRGREWRFPAWQFADDGTLPALDELIDAWPGTPLALSTWAVTPSPDLDGRTPAQALAVRGGVERVLDLARALAASAW